MAGEFLAKALGGKGNIIPFPLPGRQREAREAREKASSTQSIEAPD